ncbi:hypothetical protein JDV02_008689 [Purpureocillium takamizusanense]|uniref:RCC1-like domain-containing protein n=1 Tax=Purpureocillium takamizusanense TaxID=2060973 RepID=A0A9Q8QQW4_9HYPO|nr:uncharacterized protein JDV02_008689 [Purpureocillium takamizusanense]UNI22837.1 hypothetical protein JDV02_008689 [Purpureocillium takamizusanense]
MPPKARATASKAASSKKSTTAKPVNPQTKAPAAKPLTNGSTSSRKRKAEDDASPQPELAAAAAPLPKKTKTEASAVKPKAKKLFPEIGKKINDAPTRVLDIYVFGEGSSGELGLGSKRVNSKKPIDVKRPRLNDNLSSESVGVVQISSGGMHAAALTRDNKILTWGVNDQGALGRDTAWEGGLRDMEKEEDSDDEDEDDTGINPNESTPTAVSNEHFAPGTKFVQVVASDSATFVLTEDGRVYGWGTFRSSDGILGFTEKISVQQTPMLLPALKNIKALSAGSNHVLALDHKGNVVAWGCGQQNQLGRRIIERNKLSSLVPQGIGLPRGKTVKIACGAYHSFALDNNGHVWGWGLNNFGELGLQANAGEDDAVVLKPAKISYLADYNIVDIDGGVHHSLACSDKGELLTWGRVDGYQVGFEFDKLTKDDVIYDERDSPRILVKPAVVPDVANVTSVAAGSDNSFAVTGDGKVYSWGFSANYQTGQGVIDDIKTPTLVDNTAIRGKKIIGAHPGGQFSILAGVAGTAQKVNGVNGA